MFKNLTHEKVMGMARRVGRETAREYPGIEAEEITDEALTRFYAKAHHLTDVTEGYAYRVLERDAFTYAAEVRYRKIIETSQYVYTPREVKALLEHVYYDPSAWDVPTGKDDRLSAEIDRKSIGISLMDLKDAMGRIRPEYRRTIEKRYYLGDDIHPQSLSRAVEALTRSVNRISARTGQADDCPGSRTAMSNSRARYITNAEMGHETNPHGRDALAMLQKERKEERSDPPGTHFDWNKYD